MEAVEAPGGGGRPEGRGLTATHGNPDVARTHMQIILGSNWGGLKIKPNMLAVSGDARCRVTQEVRGSGGTLLRMRGGPASSQPEQPWTAGAVPRETSEDKGQANLRDSGGAPSTLLSPGLYSRLGRSLWVSGSLSGTKFHGVKGAPCLRLCWTRESRRAARRLTAKISNDQASDNI